ncbi:MFS transporter [Arthrobacter sp. NPDC092385]|uniref:MFS transporter n=1 Tax=Arthrobacter sp. NPDC092385 TaxID=3363943 RepID=UPI00380F0167
MSATDAVKDDLDSPALASAVKKAARHLMPMLIILYFVAFLDRTNVGYAEAALEMDRGISAGAFALGAGIFFIGYAIFEIPSNLLLKKFGARWWLARIAVTWGIVASAFAFTTGDTMFIVLRFLLGVTEAGLFPGVIMFLSEWFPNKVRVQMFALFYLAQPFSQMLGNPISGALISFGDTYTPWRGWQVMFFTEGMMAVIAGIAAIFFLIDSPQKAKWLDKDEKRALLRVMEAEDEVRSTDGPSGILRAMGNWKVWYFTVIYFCLQVAVYGTTFYLPQQVRRIISPDAEFWQIGLISAIPWFVGLFVCYFVGKNANTIRRRRTWGTMFYVSTGLATIGAAFAGENGMPVLAIAFLVVSVSSFLACGPITWSYPTAFLTGTAAAAGIGLINSLGNLGGFVAPIMRTAIDERYATETGLYGTISVGVFAFLAAVMFILTRNMRSRSDALLVAEEKEAAVPGH